MCDLAVFKISQFMGRVKATQYISSCIKSNKIDQCVHKMCMKFDMVDQLGEVCENLSA